MSLEYIDNQEDWNDLVLEQGSSFMQSWEWGEFKEKLGHKIWRMAINEDIRCPLCAQIIKHSLPFGKCYFYIPKAPIFDHQLSTTNLQPMELLIKGLSKLARKEKAIFLKVEPNMELRIKNQELRMEFEKLGFRKSGSIQPKDTLILDITQSEETLITGFHPKTRYNIHLAEKKGVSTKEINKAEFDEFYELVEKTDARKHIKSFGKKYYQELFRLSQSGDTEYLQVKFLAAFHDEKMIAGLILILWGERATYLVGANDYQHRSLMAPHLLQWQAIKIAKAADCKQYDFWGIIREDNFKDKKDFENHPWQGITRFKQGFGGRPVSHVDSYDYVFSPTWYKMYQVAKSKNKSQKSK